MEDDLKDWNLWIIQVDLPLQDKFVTRKTVIMMSSSNGAISTLLAICAGNSPVPGEFHTQRPVMRGFDVFFDLRLNKRLSKQSWGWWFETPSSPLWRHRNMFCTPSRYSPYDEWRAALCTKMCWIVSYRGISNYGKQQFLPRSNKMEL